MSFKYKVEESKVLPDVEIFTPDIWTDYRGTMWTHWEQSMDTPEQKISKFTHSRKNVLRGLHGDNETWKHITCVYGAFYLVVVDYREDSPRFLHQISLQIIVEQCGHIGNNLWTHHHRKFQNSHTLVKMFYEVFMEMM